MGAIRVVDRLQDLSDVTTPSSGILVWNASTSGFVGRPLFGATLITADATVSTLGTYLCSGYAATGFASTGITISLAAASGFTLPIVFKKIDPYIYPVYITPIGGTIDGKSSLEIRVPMAFIELTPYGNNWYVTRF